MSPTSFFVQRLMNIPKLNIHQFLFSYDIWDIYDDLQKTKMMRNML